MDYQVIDSDKYLEAGIELFMFPGGEPHVKFHKPIADEGLLFLKLRSWQDVGYAAVLMDAITGQAGANWRAFIPYYPGARQDRRTVPLSPITVDLMYSLLHTHFIRTWTFDPHSDVLRKREHRFLMPTDLQVPIKDDVVGIIAPDKGALGRAYIFQQKFYPTASLLECSKVRDPNTGRITKYELPLLSKAGRYIIVDDLCDGGATFNMLAEEFTSYHSSACKLELFVSHAIFSRGIGNIHNRIEHVTTTDSFTRLQSSAWLTILPLNQLFDKIMESE